MPMYRLITLTIGAAASVLCAAYGARRRDKLIGQAVISAAAAGLVYILVFFALKADFLYVLVMPAGQLASVVYSVIRRQRQRVFSAVCVYICVDAAFLPFFLCEEMTWKYAAGMAVFLLCLMMSLPAPGQDHVTSVDFYPEREGRYDPSGLIPCIILIPEVLVLAAARPVTEEQALMISAGFLLLLCPALWLKHEFGRRAAAEEMSRAMNRWQYESRDYMNTIRAQRHDFNLHLHAISGLLSSGNYKKCGEYINKLVFDANAVNDIMPVNDAVVGSMLYNMREEARRKGSDIVYDITYDMADILCNGFECNKIIGNLLQNAIDALITEEDRRQGIRLSIFKRRGNTVSISENRFAGDPNRIAAVFEPGYSTKRGHEGIGLAMVRRTVDAYGGRIYPEFDGDIIRFVVNVPNKVNLLEEDRSS